jgi:UDP-N-acetylmuramoylalanine--D-glutamate ligase
MFDTLTMELANKKITVVGLGVTGIAVARFLKQRGAAVVVTDLAAEEQLGPQVQAVREMGIAMELGRHRSETFTKADLVVLSPGVAHTIKPVLEAKERGIPVIGEIELASRFIEEPILAVTGTNGKTTTTEILGSMLKQSGFRVFVGGNIGNPLIGYAEGEQKADLIVAEISSFQLDTIDTFRPRIGVLLNITVDHLDRYPDFEAYAASKIRIFENQQPDDIAVLNGSDPLVRSLSGPLKSTKLYYASLNDKEEGAFYNGTGIRFRFNESLNGDDKLRMARLASSDRMCLELSSLKVIGRHNLENATAAALAALAAGASPETIQAALSRYRGAAHRLEHIGTIHGADFYNDSKATNVDAVIRALESFTKPVVLIMGGLDKGGNFQALREVLPRHVKKLIVMGKAAGLIQTVIADTVPTISAVSMADAVKKAYRFVAPDDVVLLSPGCASFDMYDNYAQRGEDFRMAVENLKLRIS